MVHRLCKSGMTASDCEGTYLDVVEGGVLVGGEVLQKISMRDQQV